MCIFRSFDLFQFPLDQQRALTYSVRVHPGLSASRLARMRTLARLIVKSFLGAKTRYKYKSPQFHDFCTFLFTSACKSLSCRMVNFFILFKICIAITILEFIPKLRPFRNFSTYRSLCITSTTLMQAFISLFR